MKTTMTSSLRVVVLGAEKTGKSAVTVRFLTKRFIGEYNSNIDLLYKSCIKQEDYLTDIEILDTCSKKVDINSYSSSSNCQNPNDKSPQKCGYKIKKQCSSLGKAEINIRNHKNLNE